MAPADSMDRVESAMQLADSGVELSKKRFECLMPYLTPLARGVGSQTRPTNYLGVCAKRGLGIRDGRKWQPYIGGPARPTFVSNFCGFLCVCGISDSTFYRSGFGARCD